MRKKIILSVALTINSFWALTAIAASDDKYPAANFEPSVVYIDQAYAATSAAPAAGKTQHDDKYPAANFEPKVIFSDDSAATTSSSSAGAAPQIDSKYPAAYFQPKVIYP